LTYEAAFEQVAVGHRMIPLTARRRQLLAVGGPDVRGKITRVFMQLLAAAGLDVAQVLTVNDGRVGDQLSGGGEQHPESRKDPEGW
jgi:hypothetical protein